MAKSKRQRVRIPLLFSGFGRGMLTLDRDTHSDALRSDASPARRTCVEPHDRSGVA